MTINKNLWKGFPGADQEKGLQRLWRSHSDAVNKALLIRWLSGGQSESLLKTDLFDEAVNEELNHQLTSPAKKGHGGIRQYDFASKGNPGEVLSKTLGNNSF